MGEFGQTAICGASFRIDCWGAGPFVIVASGKSYRFEDSDRFGPALIRLNGDLTANPYPPERSPFWRAHCIWSVQGRRTAEDGVCCIWDEPAPQVVEKRGKGRGFWLVIEPGEEDGKVVFRSDAPAPQPSKPGEGV